MSYNFYRGMHPGPHGGPGMHRGSGFGMSHRHGPGYGPHRPPMPPRYRYGYRRYTGGGCCGCIIPMILLAFAAAFLLQFLF